MPLAHCREPSHPDHDAVRSWSRAVRGREVVRGRARHGSISCSHPGRTFVVRAPAAPAARLGGSACRPGLWGAAFSDRYARGFCWPGPMAVVASGEDGAAPGAGRDRCGRGSRPGLCRRSRPGGAWRRRAAPLGRARERAAAVAASFARRTDARSNATFCAKFVGPAIAARRVADAAKLELLSTAPAKCALIGTEIGTGRKKTLGYLTGSLSGGDMPTM
jgi:hypothetical protein